MLVCCVLLEVAFVLLDYHVNYGRLIDVGAIRRMTNIAQEDGLASWFGVTQTLFVALTSWVLWLMVCAAGANRWRRFGWLVVSVVFSYMAVDDGAQLHEFIEGLDRDHPWNLYTWAVARVDLTEFTEARFRQSAYQTLDHFGRSAEEFLEMLAMTLLWVTFLKHLPVAAGSVSVALRAEPTN